MLGKFLVATRKLLFALHVIETVFFCIHATAVKTVYSLSAPLNHMEIEKMTVLSLLSIGPVW